MKKNLAWFTTVARCAKSFEPNLK